MVAAGRAAPYQARRLGDRGVPYDLFLDPGRALAGRFGLRTRSLPGYLFDLRAWLRWIAAFLRHRRQYRITGHYSDVPAVAITTGDGTVAWLHRGRALGDYPPIGSLLAALRDVMRNNG